MTPPAHDETANVVRLFLTAPVLLLLLCAVLAAVALLASGSGRLERLTALAARAADRLARPHALLTLWGLAAIVLLAVLMSALSPVKALAAVNLILFVGALTLLAVGLGASALTIGRAVSAALRPDLPADALVALRLGVSTLLLASAVPFLGWALALLALGSGVGAILEGLARRDR